jgi:hypothetical protein
VTESVVDPYAELIEKLGEFEFDPLGFVLWSFPWGEPSTDLEHDDGPDHWQREALTKVGDALRAGGDLGAVVQMAVRSGHGVGKSAFVAWTVLWALSTHELTRGRVSAMTDSQLRNITWAELAKWHGLFIAKDLFDLQATSLSFANEKLARTWRIDATPWSKHKPAAFAGLHNKRKRILLIFDEASEIDPVIWETAEGALTDKETQIIWVALGNPTQPTGRFADCFRHGSRWESVTVDSRTSKFSNKDKIAEWIEDYGEDSDFVRVRVRGLPPRIGINTFISEDIVVAARRRDLAPSAFQGWPKSMGIDPAREGDDLSCITLRQGPKMLGQWTYSGLDGPDLAARAVDLWRQHPELSVCGVDAIGIGASCVDALKRVPNFPLVPVNVALPAKDDTLYYNIRVELWGRMREWLKTAAILGDKDKGGDELAAELYTPKYGFDGKSRFQLEAKKDMKKADRLGRSPDRADSLAMTFIDDTVARKPSVTVKAQPATQRRRVIWSR